MRVDWFRLITELQATKVSLRKQSSVAEVALATVYYWKAGGEPKFYHGARLVQYYTSITGKPPPVQATMSST